MKKYEIVKDLNDKFIVRIHDGKQIKSMNINGGNYYDKGNVT